jgi:hypothetical protein
VAVAIITKSISKGSIFAFTIKSWAAFIAKMSSYPILKNSSFFYSCTK